MNPKTLVAVALVLAPVILALGPVASAEAKKEWQVQAYLHEYEGGLHMLPEIIQGPRVGETLVVTVVNTGQGDHNLVFCGDPRSPSSDCQDKWAFTPIIPGGCAPGEEEACTATITVPLPRAGEFDYYCDIPGHKSGGMKGVLHVQGEEADRGTPGIGPLGILMSLAGLALLLRKR